MANCNPYQDEDIKRLTDEYSRNGTFDGLLKTKLRQYYKLICNIDDETKINEKINKYYAEHQLNKTTPAPPKPAAARPPAPAARPAVAPAARPPAPAPPKPAAARPPAPAAAPVKNTDSSLIEILKDHGVENPKDVLSDKSEGPVAPVIITPPPSLRPASRSASSRSASLRPASRSASSRSASSKSSSLRPDRQKLPSKLQEPKKVGVIPGSTKRSTQPSGKPLVLRKKILPCDSLNNDKEYYNLRNLDNLSSTDNDIPFKDPLIDSTDFYTKNNKLFQIYSENPKIYKQDHVLYAIITQIYDVLNTNLMYDIENIETNMTEIDVEIAKIKDKIKAIKINGNTSITIAKQTIMYNHLLFINTEIQLNFNKIYSIQTNITDNYDCEISTLEKYIIIDILQSYFLAIYQYIIIKTFKKLLKLYLCSDENKDRLIILLIDYIINLFKYKNNIYLFVKDQIKNQYSKTNTNTFFTNLTVIIHEYGDDNILIQQLSDNIYNYLTKKTPINRIINILETEYKKEAIYNIEKGIYDLFYSKKLPPNHTIKYIVNEKNYEANYSVYSDYSKKFELILNDEDDEDDEDDENNEKLFKLLITNECVCKKIYHIYDILCEPTTKNTNEFIQKFIINDETIKNMSTFIYKKIKEYNQYYNALKHINYGKLSNITIHYAYANNLQSFGNLIIFNKFFYNIDITDIDDEKYYEDFKERLGNALVNIGVIYNDKKYHEIINNLKKL